MRFISNVSRLAIDFSALNLVLHLCLPKGTIRSGMHFLRTYLV
jgi:hypothetical protein